MSGYNRRRYLTATVLDQALLDWCADNLECRIELACDIEAPDGSIIRVSDRNKYVGEYFYEALANFPSVSRTVGEWLSPELQFSTFAIEVSNADGRFNRYLPGGADYASWIGNSVTVKIGLGEQAATYSTVFAGKITEAGGISRSVKSLKFIARDNYDILNTAFPLNVFKYSDYPKIQENIAGTLKPVIYGDYTVSLDPAPAVITGFVVNGSNPQLDLESRDIESISVASPGVFTSKRHLLDAGDEIQFESTGTLPAPLVAATSYWVISIGTDQFTVSTSFGGPELAITLAGSGSHTFKAVVRMPVQGVVADNDLMSLNEIWVKRSELYYRVPTSAYTVGSGNKSFSVDQGGTWFDGGPYEYNQQDLFYVKCRGKDLGADSDNIVAQARDILETYTGVTAFDANWGTFKTKVASIKSRVWESEAKPALTYALSLLEQVRLEAFINRAGNLKINSLHFDDFIASPTYTIDNWDIVKDSFEPEIDERNNFNRVQGSFDFHPDTGEQTQRTRIQRNSAAITQVGKEISKKVEFPNLYVESDVKTQVQEILKIASASIETVKCSLTWRSFLKDIGDFVVLDIDIGAVSFDNVVGMVRSVGYDPKGLQITVEIWVFAMCPFPGYVPGYPGTVGGYNAIITEE